jgi:hypothetical protein
MTEAVSMNIAMAGNKIAEESIVTPCSDPVSDAHLPPDAVALVFLSLFAAGHREAGTRPSYQIAI